MKVKMKWYFNQTQNQQVIVVPTISIVNPCLGVIAVKDVQYIPRSVCNKNQVCQALQICHICITNSDHDYTIDIFLSGPNGL